MQRGEKRAEVIDAISEEEFLKNYNPADYDRPSVTVDILVFTLSERGELSLLLIERGTGRCREVLWIWRRALMRRRSGSFWRKPG